MYVIKINNMKFRSHIGVFQEEKKIGQNLEIDWAVQINHSVEVDNIDSKINYDHFYLLVSEVVSNSQVDLIETLGTIIVTRIKEIDTRKIVGVKVNIRKINIPENTITQEPVHTHIDFRYKLSLSSKKPTRVELETYLMGKYQVPNEL